MSLSVRHPRPEPHGPLTVRHSISASNRQSNQQSEQPREQHGEQQSTCRGIAHGKRRRMLPGMSVRRQRAFTLIEIMVVVVIMGVLAALVVPRLMGRTDDARILAAKQDIATLMQALKLYRLDNNRYPTTEQGLQALVARPASGPVPANWKTGGYVDRLNKDPWGNPYQYLSPGVRGEVDLFSLGADGRPGGTGIDADIGSWQE